MEETISRMAGAGWGIQMMPEEFDDAIRAIGRTPGVRTTTYDRIETESRLLSRNTSGHLTVMVIPIDDRVSSPKGLHSRFHLGTITSDEGRGRESPEIPSCQGGGSSLRITCM